MGVIDVENLKMEYSIVEQGWLKKKRIKNAVDGISFCVTKGEIFALLGPNGAGKTTTIKILTTLLEPTSGKASVFGFNCKTDYRKIRPKINVLFGGERNLYWKLTGCDNLRYFSDLYLIPTREQKKRIPYLLDLVGLKDDANRVIATYSKGMKQRLQIARCLLNDPDVLFLDEPTIGLDPEGAVQLRSLVNDMRTAGKTILLTTHYMQEADELADRVAFISNGKLIAVDTPPNLKRASTVKTIANVSIKGANEEILKNILLPQSLTITSFRSLEGNLHISLKSIDEHLLIQDYVSVFKGNEVISVDLRPISLEDVYMEMLV